MTDFVSNPHFWDEQYLHNKAGWDLKSPTPVFSHIVKEKKIIQVGKLLILGSGHGYDAVEAAKNGFEVTAIDFSIQANLFAQSLAKDSNANVELLASDFFNLTKKYTVLKKGCS